LDIRERDTHTEREREFKKLTIVSSTATGRRLNVAIKPKGIRFTVYAHTIYNIIYTLHTYIILYVYIKCTINHPSASVRDWRYMRIHLYNIMYINAHSTAKMHANVYYILYYYYIHGTTEQLKKKNVYNLRTPLLYIIIIII